MIHPTAAQKPGRANPESAATYPNVAGRGCITLIRPFLIAPARWPALAQAGALWQGSARLWKPFWPFLIVRGTLP
jgi:hypothetical protein